MSPAPSEKTVCFSGHRNIPASEYPRMEALLVQAIDAQLTKDFSRFICGGALGFDTLAAQAVLAARAYNPQVKLVLALPYKGQYKSWLPADQTLYLEICARADEVHYIAEAYTPACMLARNRFMVDRSDLLLAYCSKPSGGTAYTVQYAIKSNVPWINLRAASRTY